MSRHITDKAVIGGRLVFALSCLLAILAPWVRVQSSPGPVPDTSFPGWPTSLQGRPLSRLPLSAQEERFLSVFPGKIGRFTDGKRQYILRWITQPTRRQHSALDCFRASGYQISAQTIWRDETGQAWSQFQATRKGQNLMVSERLCDTAGNSWSDVSAWYWAALRKQSQGPWWAMTIVERH